MKKILFFLLFLFSCTPSDYSQIKVIEVIDGDTIKLADGRLLRYIGIDASEIRSREGEEFFYNPAPFSLEAKDFNRRLVENKYVRVEFDLERKDRYGRLLGYCFVGEKFVNGELIKNGLAFLYINPPNVKYAQLLANLQKEARKEKRGVWKSWEPISSEEARAYLGQIRVIRGRVLDSYQGSRCVFLNFGRDWKDDFTVIIFNEYLKYFYAQGINPLDFYTGKVVEVMGKVKEYNGPEIIVRHPYSIEVVEE